MKAGSNYIYLKEKDKKKGQMKKETKEKNEWERQNKY